MLVNPPNVLTQVSLGSLTNIWGVDASNAIYQYNGSVWTRINGVLKQVSAAPDGTVWGVHPNGTIYQYAGNNTWNQMSGSLKQVSVGSSSNVWGVNSSNQTYIYDQGTWVMVADGTFNQICATQEQGPPIAAIAYGVTPQGALSQCFYYQGKATWTAVPTVAGGGQTKSIVSVSVVRPLMAGFRTSDSIFVVDTDGVSYQWIGGGTTMMNLMKPLARSFAYASDLKTYVLIDLQGKTQQNPQSAGWNTSVEGPAPTVPTGYLKLVNRNSGKVLDLYGASMDDGAIVQQYGYGGGLNQQWSLVPIDTTYYQIVNRNSGKVLDVNGSSMDDGAKVQQWWYGSGTNQQWSLIPTDTTYYKIVNRNSGKVLDVNGASMSDGAIVAQWGDNGGANQQWSFVPVS